MSDNACIRPKVYDLLKNATACNPGLYLDKFTEPGDQEGQKRQLNEWPKRSATHDAAFEQGKAKRNDMLKGINAKRWTRSTSAPLALHLSRSTPLENAGICLHPVYGFAYLPGSGLKGMAHAYACTVWLPSEAKDESDEEKKKIWDRVINVFGAAPSKWIDNPKAKKDEGPGLVQEAEKALGVTLLPTEPAERKRVLSEWNRAGSVVFHDAWPTSWPKVVIDIVNNHHNDYYEGKDEPGDWEDPRMVYFPAIAKDTEFEFALSPRSSSCDSAQVIKDACEWLNGALTHLGAGAKTNAGYGGFAPLEGESAALPDGAPFERFEATLELVTPAFLAGANQKEEDCDLRSATLRGLLRWWWRTLHAGYVDVQTLRKMESVVWGNTERAGGVKVMVEKEDSRIPHDNWSVRQNSGLGYLTFGVNGLQESAKRHWHEAGTKWKVTMVAKGTVFLEDSKSVEVSAKDALDQAKAALWLLCHYGGVGARSRKGFGSLSEVVVADTFDQVKYSQIAREFRCLLAKALPTITREEAMPSGSSSIGLAKLECLVIEDTTTTFTDPLDALEALGRAYKSFLMERQNRELSSSLGLPRTGKSDARYASPVHFHWFTGQEKKLCLRAIAFPNAFGTRLSCTSEENTLFLKGFLAHVTREIGVSEDIGGASENRIQKRSETQTRELKPHQIVKVILLEEKTKKGGWKAKLADGEKSGHIVNSSDLPPESKAGDRLELSINSVSSTDGSIAFRYSSTKT